MADNDPIVRLDMTDGAGAEEQLIDDTAGTTAEAEDDVIILAADRPTADPLPANAVLQQDGSVILTLRRPVELKFKRDGSEGVRTEDFKTLHMRRLNGSDMRAVMAAGQGHGVTTGLAKSCRMHQPKFNAVFDRMDGADANAAARVLDFFLDAGA